MPHAATPKDVNKRLRSIVKPEMLQLAEPYVTTECAMLGATLRAAMDCGLINWPEIVVRASHFCVTLSSACQPFASPAVCADDRS